MANTTMSDREPKTEGTSRSARAESNRRNAQKSTGPRTAAGTARSRFNALKHGMTARAPLLPEEDASELAAQLLELGDDLQPGNKLEAMLVEAHCRRCVAIRPRPKPLGR